MGFLALILGTISAIVSISVHRRSIKIGLGILAVLLLGFSFACCYWGLH
ncbi:MAG: hypothetical protein ABFD69_09820 [Candidatus Sumerlaeia bacterium]